MSNELIGFLGIAFVLSLVGTALRSLSRNADTMLHDAERRRRAKQVDDMFKEGRISTSECRILLRHVQEGGHLNPLTLDDEGRPMTAYEREEVTL